MNWKTKNTIFKVLEKAPFQSSMYYFIQKNITKSVYWKEDEVESVFYKKCRRHFETIEKWGNIPTLENCTLFEFGAGWDLFAPIGFSLCKNIKEYIAVDLNEYVKSDLVYKSLELYQLLEQKEQLGEGNQIPGKRLENLLEKFPTKGKNTELKNYLSEQLQIRYCAPMDAGDTKLPEESVDYVISNVTLEHIPPESIDRIFKECYRILKPNGLISLSIDYSDHWAHSDSSISMYNYLQFDEKEWKKYNPSMHYQNRLCKPDYIELFEKNGFKILHVVDTKEGDKDKLAQIELAEQFKKYKMEDLLCRGNYFVVQKKS